MMLTEQLPDIKEPELLDKARLLQRKRTVLRTGI